MVGYIECIFINKSISYYTKLKNHNRDTKQNRNCQQTNMETEQENIGIYYAKQKEILACESVHRGLRPEEITDFDEQGNFYIKGRRLTALRCITPNGDVVSAEKLPKPGFSVTPGMTVGEFGPLSVKISTADILADGGRFLSSIDGPDYFYAEVPEGKSIRVVVVRGSEKYAKIGALMNILAEEEANFKFVITPMGDTPVEAGYRLPDGEHKISFRQAGKSIIIEDMPDFFVDNPKLYHSLILSILMRMGFHREKFDISDIKLPNGEVFTTDRYLDDQVIKKMKSEPDSITVYNESNNS